MQMECSERYAAHSHAVIMKRKLTICSYRIVVECVLLSQPLEELTTCPHRLCLLHHCYQMDQAPLTEFPISFNRGEKVQKPHSPGITVMIAPAGALSSRQLQQHEVPPTPDLAGNPILNAKSPELSYIPHENLHTIPSH